MLAATISAVQQDNPDKVNDIGVFALPARMPRTPRSRCGSRTPSTSPSRHPTTSSTRRRSSSRSPTRRTAARCRTRAARPRARTSSACTLPERVPTMIGDIQAYFDSGKAGLRWSSCLRSRDRTWRTSPSRSVPASRPRGGRGAVRPGRDAAGPAARPQGLVTDDDDDCRHDDAPRCRSDENHGGRPARDEEPVPELVLHPCGGVVHRVLRGADVRGVLFLVDSVDAVRRVHRVRQLRPVLPGAADGAGVHQHVRLRLHDAAAKVVLGLALALLLTSPSSVAVTSGR